MHKLLAWTDKVKQDAFFAVTQKTSGSDNFTIQTLFSGFGTFLVCPLQVDLDTRKAVLHTRPYLTEVVVFQLSHSLDVDSKKAFLDTARRIFSLLRPAVAGIPSECGQTLSGWIQKSLAVELPNLATSDRNKGPASHFPTGKPTTRELPLTTRYIGIVSWQSESAQQHFLARIMVAPELEQARLYGNKLASFCPHVESVLVSLELFTEFRVQLERRPWAPVSQRADERLFG